MDAIIGPDIVRRKFKQCVGLGLPLVNCKEVEFVTNFLRLMSHPVASPWILCKTCMLRHCPVLSEETSDGKFSEFVVSKTQVAPLKAQTIPRLELLSALLLARLITNVADSLRYRFLLKEPRCFTESQVALFWITGIEREWNPFVQNRVTSPPEVSPLWNVNYGDLVHTDWR